MFAAEAPPDDTNTSSPVGVAQSVERDLAKVEVAGSRPAAHSSSETADLETRWNESAQDRGPAAPAVSEIPGQMTVEEVIAETEKPEPQYEVDITPSGLSIYYSWAPRRHYRLHQGDFDPVNEDFTAWKEVPSVTNILGVLDKSGPLTWWGMKVGLEGALHLVRDQELLLTNYTVDELVDLLTEHKLTVNHQKDKAAERGVNVHGALEAWCETTTIPSPTQWQEPERGYVEGLVKFLAAIVHGRTRDVKAEVMVGSLGHLYAGRYDLRLTLERPVEVVTRTYPKRADKVKEIPAGRYLLDLKTSRRVYDSHFLQLEAYEKASVECGYEPTDYRGVIHVTADGKYELALNKDWCFDDFAKVREVYTVMNEREVLRVLREELGAKEVA